MARTVRNAKIDSRSARQKLARRREPHWTVLVEGCALGYRKGVNGGTWIGRFRDDRGNQHYESLGQSDDVGDANDLTILSFAQAQRRAQSFFQAKQQSLAEGFSATSKPATVHDALENYFAAYVRRGGKSLKKMRSSAQTHIVSQLGAIMLHKLTRRRLEQWHSDIARSAPSVRGKRGQPARVTTAASKTDQRKRSATANRILTILKAALNHARNEGHIELNFAWERVRAFREVDVARQRYLSDDEAHKLVNACSPHFRKLVVAGLLTGCRYGELCSLTCEDFNLDSGTVLVRISKSGKSRHVAVATEGCAFFAKEVKDRPRHDTIFLRPDGMAWSNSDQQRPMQQAVVQASITPITFHGLRHTYASRLAMRAVPLAVIAKQLGHSDTRMVEKHYGHLAPNYVADTIRAAFGTLDIGISDQDLITAA
jgi:integrase